MSYLSQVSIGFADTGSIDAFSRLRVSQTANLFDAQFTYNLSPLVYEQITSGSGATITHDATNRMALMTFSSTPTGGKAYMQSYEYIPYQPGRSQLAFVTFNMIEGVSNVLKFAGLSDGVNGIEFQVSGSTKQFVVYSGTSAGNETITQANWNLDKLDGTGVSQLTLDITKTQIFVIDLQALYVGRVRVGFDIDGSVYYAHQFVHANRIAYPYIATANLPIRCGMTCTGTVSTTMNFICSSVASEGGETDIRGRTFTTEGTGTAGNNSRAAILSVRPKTTFNSIANRSKFELESINILNTGTRAILIEVCLGQALTSASYVDVNTTYSAFEYDQTGTLSGNPAIVVSSFYVGTNSVAPLGLSNINSKYPITLNQAGVARSLGTITILATGIGGTSACRASMTWREIR